MMNFSHAPLTNWGLNFIKFEDNWTILDIGCGGGATLKRLLKKAKMPMYMVLIYQRKVLLNPRKFVKICLINKFMSFHYLL